MDLVTLIAACVPAFDQKLMHAIVIAESQGQPYSFREIGQTENHTFSSMAAVIEAARKRQLGGASLRLGLAGIEADLHAEASKPNEGIFEPCLNIQLAASRMDRLRKTCKERKPKADPLGCALASYRTSLEEPDWQFADEIFVQASLGNQPNPDLSPAPPARQVAAVPVQPPKPRTRDGIKLPDGLDERAVEFFDAGGGLFFDGAPEVEQGEAANQLKPALGRRETKQAAKGETVLLPSRQGF